VIVPDAPTTVVAAAGDTIASVSWVAPVSDGGSPILGYAVTPHDLTTSLDGTPYQASGTSTTVPGLADGHTYDFTVTAANSAGPSLDSTPSAQVTPQPSAPPPQTTITTIPITGGTATSDPTSSSQIIANVTVPGDAGGGSVTMATTTVSTAPTGYVFVGQQVIIVSTAATSVGSPLVLVFNINPSLVPVDIFRDGVVVGPCTGAPGTAVPSPCVASGAGTAQVTVLTASASQWNVGLRKYGFSVFFQPLNDPISATNPMSVFKGGSTIAVKFALTYANGSLIPDAAASTIAAACGATISLVRTAGTAPPVDEVVTSTTPNAGNCFRYDSTAHQFIFNLGTKGLTAPAQYALSASIVGPDKTLLATHRLAVGLR
jgi:hypothetical protein